jgi:hypothetical protein
MLQKQRPARANELAVAGDVRPARSRAQSRLMAVLASPKEPRTHLSEFFAPLIALVACGVRLRCVLTDAPC